MKLIAIFLLLGCTSGVFSQDLIELRHYVTPHNSADFYISLGAEKVKFIDTLDYSWFKSQQLHVTQGYAGGNLLDGPFTEYYVSGQLSRSGIFEQGLQTGEWKSWYESGQLASIYNYKNGVLHGNYFLFDSTGQLIGSGHFRNGKYHGKKVENGEETRFRNGKKKEKKIKGDKPEKDKSEKEKEEGEKESDENTIKENRPRSGFKIFGREKKPEHTGGNEKS
jgi:hypothetical protein